MWLPLGVGNVVCVNGVVYVWSDLFQSVSSPPLFRYVDEDWLSSSLAWMWACP